MQATSSNATARCSECGERVCNSDTCPKLRRDIRAMIAENRDAWMALPEDNFIQVTGKFAIVAMIVRMER